MGKLWVLTWGTRVRISEVDYIREIWPNGIEVGPRHPENPLQLRRENVIMGRTSMLP